MSLSQQLSCDPQHQRGTQSWSSICALMYLSKAEDGAEFPGGMAISLRLESKNRTNMNEMYSVHLNVLSKTLIMNKNRDKDPHTNLSGTQLYFY